MYDEYRHLFIFFADQLQPKIEKFCGRYPDIS